MHATCTYICLDPAEHNPLVLGTVSQPEAVPRYCSDNKILPSEQSKGFRWKKAHLWKRKSYSDTCTKDRVVFHSTGFFSKGVSFTHSMYFVLCFVHRHTFSPVLCPFLYTASCSCLSPLLLSPQSLFNLPFCCCCRDMGLAVAVCQYIT